MNRMILPFACLILSLTSLCAETVPSAQDTNASDPTPVVVATESNATMLPESNMTMVDASGTVIVPSAVSKAAAQCMPFLMGVDIDIRNSYVESSLTKLGIKCGLFGDILVEPEELGKKALTNEELDDIFLSFMVEKERKKEEERLRIAAEELLKKNMEGNPAVGPNVSFSDDRGVPVYSHDVNNPMIIPPNKSRFQSEAVPLPPVLEGEEGTEKSVSTNITIVGIICDHGKCTAYTSAGLISVGKKIGDTEEKVLAVKSSGIKTDKRWISFD